MNFSDCYDSDYSNIPNHKQSFDYLSQCCSSPAKSIVSEVVQMSANKWRANSLIPMIKRATRLHLHLKKKVILTALVICMSGDDI